MFFTAKSIHRNVKLEQKIITELAGILWTSELRCDILMVDAELQGSGESLHFLKKMAGTFGRKINASTIFQQNQNVHRKVARSLDSVI